MPRQPTTFEEILGISSQEDQAEQDSELSQRLADMKETFSTPHGRRVLRLITRVSEDDPMTGNSQTYHNLGAWKWANGVLDLMAVADFDSYIWVKSQRAIELGERYTDKITK